MASPGQELEDAAQQKLIDEVNNLKQEDLPKGFQSFIDIKQLKETCNKANSISILLTGKAKAGKSTLINGILGLDVEDKEAYLVEQVAEEGRSLEKCTTEVAQYTRQKGKITVTVWDSPGLQDGTSNQEEYLQQMKAQCADRDLTIYCIRVTEGMFVRGRDNPDVLAMEKLTATFAVDFWKNTVIVLTFANIIEHLNPQWDDLPTKEEKIDVFQAVKQDWEDKIREVLIKDIEVPKVMVDNVRIVTAGHHRKPNLPDRNYWFSSLWWQCLGTIPDQEKASLIMLNACRFKTLEELEDDDVEQPLYKQQIIVQDKYFRTAADQDLGAVKAGSPALGAILGAMTMNTGTGA